MVLARRAGRKPAPAATSARMTSAALTEAISVALTPNNCVETYLLTASAAGIPMARPAATSTSVSRITIHTTCARGAPSAILRPISLVRRATMNAITPYNPSAASTVASRPKAADSTAIRRWKARALSGSLEPGAEGQIVERDGLRLLIVPYEH